MNQPLLGLFALVLLLAAACGTTKSSSRTDAFRSVTLKQGGCFGTCPVFTMRVAPDGSATYNGKRYAPFKDLNTGTLPADSLAKLARQTEAVLAQADNLPREIDSGIADLAQSTITIVTDRDSLVFKGTSEYAEPVAQLRTTLLSIAKATDWQRDPSAGPEPASQLMVTLQAADQVQVVTEEFYR